MYACTFIVYLHLYLTNGFVQKEFESELSGSSKFYCKQVDPTFPIVHNLRSPDTSAYWKYIFLISQTKQ